MLKKYSSFLKKNYLLVIIVVLAAILRFSWIENMPPSLNWDEVSHGYNAYSILKTGKDEWGNFFPMIFRAYGDYKLPFYVYLTTLSEYFLGLNAYSIRLPSVLAGIGTVFFTYFLVLKLFSLDKSKSSAINSRLLASISALLVAVEPWSLFLSRAAFEANLALFLFVAGVYFFLNGLRKQSHLLISTIFFGLSVWTYNSYRIFSPMMMVVLYVIFHKEFNKALKKNKKLIIYHLLLIAVFFIPMFLQMLNPVGQARYGKVGIIDDGAVAQIIESRNVSKFPPEISRIIYNRPSFFLQNFVNNWGSHFTCSFLFFRGGDNYQFSIPGDGLLYLINLPFFFMGLLVLLKNLLKYDKKSFFLLAWLILSPIPSSITRESPHVLRSITMIPIPMILSSYGLVSTFSFLKLKSISEKLVSAKIFVIFIYVGINIISLNSYLLKYFFEYRNNYSWSWQYGYKEVIYYVKRSYEDYNKIIISKKYGEPHEFLLFYWPWDPESFRDDPNLIRFNQSNWFWVDSFDKFYFVNDWDIPKEEWQEFKLENGKEFNCQNIKCLLVTGPGNFPKTWSKLETIYFLNKDPVFEIYEN